MHAQYVKLSQRKRETLALAALKGKIFKIEELNTKVNFIKSKFIDQHA